MPNDAAVALAAAVRPSVFQVVEATAYVGHPVLAPGIGRVEKAEACWTKALPGDDLYCCAAGSGKFSGSGRRQFGVRAAIHGSGARWTWEVGGERGRNVAGTTVGIAYRAVVLDIAVTIGQGSRKRR